MLRTRKVLLALAAMSSFLVAAGTVILWWAQHSMVLSIMLGNPLSHRPTRGGMVAEKHALCFYRLDSRPIEYGPKYLTTEYSRWERQFRRHDIIRRFLGFQYIKWSQIYSGSNVDPDRTRFRGYEHSVYVPYWFIIAIALILPARALVLRHRRRRADHRRETGLCPRCGYDLRATGGQCPECGLNY